MVRLDNNEIIFNKLSGHVDRSGVMIPNITVENYIIILELDKSLNKHIAFNEFSNCYEYIMNNGLPRAWSDTDDAFFMSYIEKTYDIYNLIKYQQAIAIVMKEKSYNPIKDLIEMKEWDKVERIDNFLKDIMKCDCSLDYMNIYHREVSRMLFFGGIARLYTPGVKFDYMPILVGEQGVGKSTIVDWLALNTRYYKEVTTVDGKDGIECLEGGWICEFSELLAMTRQKDVQALKAFITRTADKYRKPYDKYVTTIPRNCIFIGTTNDSEFLTDITGNRRYLPVEVGLKRGEMFEKKALIQDYILCCWREALWKMKNDKEHFYLTIPNSYGKIVEKMQNNRVIEDPRLVELQEFLNDKELGEKVCSRMIYAEAFKGIIKQATLGDFKMIGSYMNKFKNWTRCDSTITFEKYGKQKYWMKMSD